MNQIKTMCVAGLFLALSGCGSTTKTDPADLESVGIPVEHITPTKDQQARRQQSEAYCKAHQVPVYSNPNALFVESEEKVTLRTQEEVADRALALFYMGLKSEGLEQEHLEKMDKDYHISAHFSPLEKEFAQNPTPTQQQLADANWRYESLHVMLWALGYVDSLAYPDKICDIAADVKIILELGEDGFRQKATLRSKKEILDQADLILRLHWACVSARVDEKPAPAGMDASVVYERHYSLNWLIRYSNQDWDDVSTDT